MNQSLQSDLHPEAEILNAFAELALSGPEQQRTLAHLAECSRCRQIVFLARQSAEDEQPSPEATPTPSPLSRWWSGWRILWIAAPVCAALLTLVVLFHHNVVSPTADSAQVSNQPIQLPDPHSITPAPNSASAKPGNEIAPQPVEPKTSSLRDKSLPVVPSPPSAMRPTPSTATRSESVPAPLPQPSAISATVDVTSGSAVPAPPTVSADAVQIEAASSIPQQTPPTPASPITVNSNAANIIVQPAPPPPSAMASVALKPKTPSSSRSMPAPARGTVPPPAHAIPNAAARPGVQAFASGVINPGLVGMNRAKLQKQASTALAEEVARRILYTKLPNGLTAVSTAALFDVPTQHRVLALDTAGSLFRSEDGGTSWQPIAIQWTGRPLQVRTAQIPISSSPAPCPTCASKLLFSPAVKFELITDTVSTFTSTDGLTWTLKPAAQPPQKSEP